MKLWQISILLLATATAAYFAFEALPGPAVGLATLARRIASISAARLSGPWRRPTPRAQLEATQPFSSEIAVRWFGRARSWWCSRPQAAGVD